jgi:hypothetical protein
MGVMTNKKPLFIDRATKETTKLILSDPLLLSSAKVGWDSVFLLLRFSRVITDGFLNAFQLPCIQS